MVKWHDDMLVLLTVLAVLMGLLYVVTLTLSYTEKPEPGAGGQAEDGAGP